METRRLKDMEDAIRAGDRRALARGLSLVESASADGMQLVRSLYGVSPARIVGITGPPGVGKSTLTDRLMTCMRRRGHRIAVLAVDPSSPISGGAILGDRVRMVTHAGDQGVFVRSMASRGHLGGLSEAAGRALAILAAAPFDRLIVETVGVGQSEIEIAGQADATVVLLDPTFGDGVQAEKAGLLEVADILAVNRSDEGHAWGAAHILREMVGRGSPNERKQPVVVLSALENRGVAQLNDTIELCLSEMDATGSILRRRSQRARVQFEEAIRNRTAFVVRQQIAEAAEMASRVESLEVDPWSAAEAVVVGPGSQDRCE